MITVLTGVLVVLHGLVHLWYLVLSLNLVPFRPEMGWTGRSWVLSPLLGDSGTRSLAAGLYALAAMAVVVSGVGIIRGDWSRPAVLGAGVLSAAAIVLFWDGNPGQIVAKGLVGLAISLVMVLAAVR